MYLNPNKIFFTQRKWFQVYPCSQDVLAPVVHTLQKNDLCCSTCGRYTLESIIKSKHRSDGAPPAVFIIKFKS